MPFFARPAACLHRLSGAVFLHRVGENAGDSLLARSLFNRLYRHPGIRKGP